MREVREKERELTRGRAVNVKEGVIGRRVIYGSKVKIE